MFITQEDFKVVASEAALKVITQADDANADNAIQEAVEEIAGYLRPKYDCDKIFSAEGNDRNRQIVMYAADIALYNMIAAQPQRMGSDVRKERYERAIKWLEGVAAGKIVPDLPIVTDEATGEANTNGVKWGNGPNRHSW